MKQLVCLAHESWAPFPQRTQQIMSRLKDTQVLWFQPAKGPLDADWKAAGRRVRPHVTVYTLPPLRPTQLLFRQGTPVPGEKQRRFIAEKMRRHRFRDAALWCTDPSQVHLLDGLDYTRLIYDCHQDWSHLPIEWESQLTLQADVVFAISQVMADYLSPCSSNVTVLPNGVNYNMFAQDMPQVESPSFCFVGSLYADLDAEPLVYAARQRPQWRFTVVGGVRGGGPRELDQLKRLLNVRLLGRRPHVDVPELLSRHKVCVNLLRDSDAGNGIAPVRLFEYLATGKPIVSMLWPEQVEKLADVVYGAHDEREFLQCCERALNEAPGWVTDRRRSYAEQAAWSNRLETVQRILDTLSS